MPDNQWLTVWQIKRFRSVKTLPEYISVYLHDEIPRIGCGWRRFLILSRDCEWTVLLSSASAKAAKISSSVLHNLKPRTLLPEVDYSVLSLSNRLSDIAERIVNTHKHPPKMDPDFEDSETELLEFEEDQDDDDLNVRQILLRLMAKT